MLDRTDYKVITLDRLDPAANLSRIDSILKKNKNYKDRLEVVWHDLKAPLSKFVIDKLDGVTHILHLAAGSHVNRSIKYPLEFVFDNVVGTCNLLEYARNYAKNLELFLYFSTDEVFGPAPEGIVFDENSRYNGCNPYSATKAGAEELCNAYFNTYNLPIVVTHTMNVYGPSQHEEKFIPLCIKKILNNDIVDIHTDQSGEKTSSRCYLYLEDIADAILFLMKNFKLGEKYNIAADNETSALEMVKKISKTMGVKANYRLLYPEKDRPGNDLRYAVSGEKLKKMGWCQKTDLDKGLEKTIKWYISNEK